MPPTSPIACACSPTATCCMPGCGGAVGLRAERRRWSMSATSCTCCASRARRRRLPEHGDAVLLFGKHAPHGRIDADFAARLDRAVTLWRERPPRERDPARRRRAGRTQRGRSRPAVACSRAVSPPAPALRLEAQSRDTLQNLRNARDLLGGQSARRVTLLSNRYHLARCALFARQLGFDWELCAAEPRLRFAPRRCCASPAKRISCAGATSARAGRASSASERMLARVT